MLLTWPMVVCSAIAAYAIIERRRRCAPTRISERNLSNSRAACMKANASGARFSNTTNRLSKLEHSQYDPTDYLGRMFATVTPGGFGKSFEIGRTGANAVDAIALIEIGMKADDISSSDLECEIPC